MKTIWNENKLEIFENLISSIEIHFDSLLKFISINENSKLKENLFENNFLFENLLKKYFLFNEKFCQINRWNISFHQLIDQQINSSISLFQNQIEEFFQKLFSQFDEIFSFSIQFQNQFISYSIILFLSERFFSLIIYLILLIFLSFSIYQDQFISIQFYSFFFKLSSLNYFVFFFFFFSHLEKKQNLENHQFDLKKNKRKFVYFYLLEFRMKKQREKQILK